MSFLSKIEKSSDVKTLDIKQLKILSDELREEIIAVTEKNGGHLSSNLGIIETTVALHYAFDFPNDKLIFDVGHQCYAHKILSGRANQFKNMRTDGGISGFPDYEESEYDCFNTGHAGTAISAGLGFCMARDKLKEDYFVVNVVGDGAFVNGLNLEALFAKQEKPKNFVVILNDNGMSISKNKNGFYRFISNNTTKKGYIYSKKAIKKVFKNSFVTKALVALRDFIKRVFNKRNYLEQFGFKYVEVNDGNDIKKLVKILTEIRQTPNNKAIFLHIHTTKGKGLKAAEDRSDYYHGLSGGSDKKRKSFSHDVGRKLDSIIENNPKVVAITAGMKDGTGLKYVEERHPKNFFHVGIAEEYAVTFSAGMARGGLKPFVAIYSTFLQRAYDQILHDVCIQNLPVVFLIDRAGLVGEDGKTHQGVFDLSYLTHMPNMTVLAPASVEELHRAIDYALLLNSPVAIRYPKNQADFEFESKGDFNKWQTIVDGEEVAILAVGGECLRVSELVAKNLDNRVKVVNARAIKPLDEEFLKNLTCDKIITIEENSVIGGFGALVSTFYNEKNKNILSLGVKDEFIAHGTINNQLKYNGLDEDMLADVVKKSLHL